MTREAQTKLKRVSDQHTSEVKSLKESQRQKDAQHRQTVDQMRYEFKTMLNDLQQKHEDENRSREERHSEEITVRIRMQKDTESDLNEKMEEMRSQKDAKIKELQ